MKTDTWKTGTRPDRKITVKYRISEQTAGEGKKVIRIEDQTTCTANLTLKSCIALMKNVSRHKEFTGDYSSVKIRTISAKEWIVYYYSRNPWPIANSDCVARMTFSEDRQGKVAEFRLSAAPREYEQGKVRRMTSYQVTYSFRDLGDGQVLIIETGQSTPPVKVPLWVIKSVFPNAPAKALEKFVKLAQNIDN